ncbi:uncharacterized protein LOC129615400 [Condylostylus longicornis]|uniref:uncharacterized protein LOC129615400 n=1 Tax=Condylostylus longicornis TaxID=2530218 RepID=UPI00244DA056|nr:uncharacterized protein LOC129615400 [Condylostylus longicornis]
MILCQIFAFTLISALQNSLAYVQPIHIRYSDEQLRALQDNPKPIRTDHPRELIDNPYGAQIYYEEILPNENEITKKIQTGHESSAKKGEHGENNLNTLYGNIPNRNCKNPFNCNIPISQQGSTLNHWNNPYNGNPFSSSSSVASSNDDINYDYIIFIQQYHEYLRELLYDFYLQRQMLLEVINQQEQQLQQLRGQYNQLGSAIANTEYQMYQIQSPSNHQIPSSLNVFEKETGNNQQQTVTSSKVPSTINVNIDRVDDGGSTINHNNKPVDMTKENQQMPIEN